MIKATIIMATIATLAATSLAQDWKPVPGHLMTRWAKDVTPDKVLPEYPRPQMVRKDWTNLNGLWDYAVTARDANQPEKFDGKILVPFCIESSLSGLRKPLTAEQRLWYRRSFKVDDLGKNRLLLNFGAVDWECEVLINGKSVGKHRGGFDPFTMDITAAIKTGDNEIVVSVYDSSSGTQARGKQSFETIATPKGIRYTPCSGIWQTVWLEAVPASRIDSMRIVTDIDAGTVTVTVNTTTAGKVKLAAADGDKAVATAEGDAGFPITMKIPDAKLWAPGSPFLYGLAVEFAQDKVDSYFGMRKIGLGKDDKGMTRIMLNNKEIFQVGFLDQGYWPDGIFTAPTDEALRFDIEATLKLGMNVARKHVKVEPARWYYWCDKLGLLVWQDMPCAGPRNGTLGTGAGKDKETGLVMDGRCVDPEAGMQFESELNKMVVGLQNHPSIIMWIVFNESWGQYDTARLTNWVKQLDPTRLVNNASGGHDIPSGDVLDIHVYPGPGARKPTDGRAGVLGEFGGLALPLKGHMWVDKSWGYGGTANPEDLTNRYCGLIRRSYELKDSAGLCAVIYTQTTDVETECNGLITYDREVIKPDIQKVADANKGKFDK